MRSERCDRASGLADFDQIAEHYDRTRGGEPRGDDYAAFLVELLPVGEEPVLEIGIGTGVVALGLVRRGRKVLGLDISGPMLLRAKARLGPVLVQSDATRMGIATASIAHALSIWVVHAVAEPEQLFADVARILRPGGTYVVCSAQRPSEDDVVGQIIASMGERVDLRRGSARPRGVTTEEILMWAERAGFSGSVLRLERRWMSRPSDELLAIEKRSWVAMRELDDETVEEVTKPAVEALRALPDDLTTRRATADVLVLRRG